MVGNYIKYEGKTYSNRSLTKTQANNILFGAYISPWDFAIIKGNNVIAQTAEYGNAGYLVTYEIPKRKSILDDEDALEIWMDRHIIGVYKEITKRK